MPHVATFSLINPSPELDAGPPLEREKIAGRAQKGRSKGVCEGHAH